jgi:Raf kinase inhibitor-like YbhB/YbcL family protein
MLKRLARIGSIAAGLLMAATLAVPLGCQDQPAATGEEHAMSFALSSTAFKNNERLPVRHTEDGANTSPPLEWDEPPADTMSLALICDDPDAPRGTWDHWVLWNLPGTLRKLSEGIAKTETLANPEGARQGKNSWPRIGYDGPAPPPGKVHHYNFVLYALDAPLDLKPGAGKSALLAAMKGHILGEARLTGLYSR